METYGTRCILFVLDMYPVSVTDKFIIGKIHTIRNEKKIILRYLSIDDRLQEYFYIVQKI